MDIPTAEVGLLRHLEWLPYGRIQMLSSFEAILIYNVFMIAIMYKNKVKKR